MYLDRKLQIILSTPVPGATEDIIVRHTDGAGDDLQTWIQHHPTISAEIEPLPKNMLALTIEQTAMPRLFQHDAIYAAAIDDGDATLLLQNRDELLRAATTAAAVANRLTAAAERHSATPDPL